MEGVDSAGARRFVAAFELLRPLFEFRAPEFVFDFELVVPRLEFALALFAFRSRPLRLFALFAFRFALSFFEFRFPFALFALLLLFVFLFREFLLDLSLFEFSFAGLEADTSALVLFSCAAEFSPELSGRPSSPSLADERLITTATVCPTFMISPAWGD